MQGITHSLSSPFFSLGTPSSVSFLPSSARLPGSFPSCASARAPGVSLPLGLVGAARGRATDRRRLVFVGAARGRTTDRPSARGGGPTVGGGNNNTLLSNAKEGDYDTVCHDGHPLVLARSYARLPGLGGESDDGGSGRDGTLARSWGSGSWSENGDDNQSNQSDGGSGRRNRRRKPSTAGVDGSARSLRPPSHRPRS